MSIIKIDSVEYVLAIISVLPVNFPEIREVYPFTKRCKEGQNVHWPAVMSQRALTDLCSCYFCTLRPPCFLSVSNHVEGREAVNTGLNDVFL